MTEILHTGLHEATLEILSNKLKDVRWIAVPESEVATDVALLKNKGAILVGETATNPVRVAQMVYSKDKSISILLVNDARNHPKIKQALQFAPFVGPTIKAFSNDVGLGLVAIVEDALQRTEQRRSYQVLKSEASAIPAFSANHMEKVRVNYMTRVLDEAPIGAALLSKDGTVLNVNNYIARLLNLPDRDILGMPLAAHFSDQEQEALQEFIADGYHSLDKRTFELVQGDQHKYLEISVGDMDASSSSTYKLAIVNDVTAATELQKRTQAHLEELQKLNDELKKVNEDLDTFVYTASHDLKSPILNIEGLVNLLEDGLGPEQSAVIPELEHIRLSVERFKSTIEDLTEVARIQRNFEHEATHLDLATVAREVLELLQNEIEQAEASVVLDFAAAPTLEFSKKNLKSILLNLLSNAIKYRSPDRKAEVVISSFREQGNFCLKVKDNGLGIPADKQSKVFQLFRRLHVHVKGSGVGLYIVKRIVENSGGRIDISSNESEGSTFTIYIPEAQQPLS